jgi:hypothetical protein
LSSNSPLVLPTLAMAKAMKAMKAAKKTSCWSHLNTGGNMEQIEAFVVKEPGRAPKIERLTTFYHGNWFQAVAVMSKKKKTMKISWKKLKRAEWMTVLEKLHERRAAARRRPAAAAASPR